mmetsp:Transcript_9423/g.57556  ORF Transcript_9423/g.57556 Transcript_9423/m.57556 type:complete len:122 (+) Transcript_9423:898-1263(+)
MSQQAESIFPEMLGSQPLLRLANSNTSHTNSTVHLLYTMLFLLVRKGDAQPEVACERSQEEMSSAYLRFFPNTAKAGAASVTTMGRLRERVATCAANATSPMVLKAMPNHSGDCCRIKVVA